MRDRFSADVIAAMLEPYRVLDLTDSKGWMCGKNLADLGADVIKIEKPGGDHDRGLGPFYKDIPHPEKSLFWFAYNSNKRGITLNIETDDGQEVFRRLVKSADFVIESFPPGYMDSLGLGYSDLNKINPRLIVTSITPFGQSGPYKDYVASDITVMAMSGLLYLSGDPDRPPVRISFPQACLFAGAEGAVGSLMALNYRQMTGEGQHVDISMQRSVFPATFEVIFWWHNSKFIRKRQGPARIVPTTGVIVQQIWACKDGYVTFYFFGGPWAAQNRRLVEWMDKGGFATGHLKQIDWERLDWSKITTQDEVNKLEEPLKKFFLKHTKRELLEGAIERDIMLGPLFTMEDILKDDQLRHRGSWVEVEHQELGRSVTYPGAWVKASETPLKTRRRAPLIGEHNDEIYLDELGFSKEEVVVLKKEGVI